MVKISAHGRMLVKQDFLLQAVQSDGLAYLKGGCGRTIRFLPSCQISQLKRVLRENRRLETLKSGVDFKLGKTPE